MGCSLVRGGNRQEVAKAVESVPPLRTAMAAVAAEELGLAPRDARLFMIADKRWKYVHAIGFRPMLYDLETDPNELNDLGADPAFADERARLLADAQRLVATDAVAAYLYQPTWITVANARVKGLWKDMPVFVNDLAGMSWQ